MAQSFKETAHLKTDQDKFSEGWERIFGKRKIGEGQETETKAPEEKEEETKEE